MRTVMSSLPVQPHSHTINAHVFDTCADVRPNGQGHGPPPTVQHHADSISNWSGPDGEEKNAASPYRRQGATINGGSSSPQGSSSKDTTLQVPA